jgi:hypothetical protein
MIISASRRTDIPAFYGAWFLKQLQKGFVQIANPFNPKQITSISMKKEDVDAFVFWTRFSQPFLPILKVVKEMGYSFYFLFTITGYDRSLELRTPSLQKQIDSFKELVDRYGKGIAVWRYDPIIVSTVTPFEYHLIQFEKIASQLQGFTDEVKISFYDLYRKSEKNIRTYSAHFPSIISDPTTMDGFSEFLQTLFQISRKNQIDLTSCAEEFLENHPFIREGKCIDPDRLFRLYNLKLPYKKDPSQRKYCHCSVSRDIGTYNTCKFGCLYCYATTRHFHPSSMPE